MLSTVLLFLRLSACLATTATVANLAELTAAVAPSASHDTIVITPGTYSVAATLSITRSLVLRAEGGAQAILDGSQQRLVISISGAIDVRIEGLVIANGRSSNGGAGRDGGCVKIEGGANVTIADSLIHSCAAVRDGGGILVAAGTNLRASRVRVERSVIRDNVATRGGGAISARMATNSQRFVVVHVVDSVLSGNLATTMNGGAIFFSSGGVDGLSVSRAVFSGNSAGNKGGGVCALGASQPIVRLHSVLFDNNTAGESGLALSLDGNVPDPLTNLTFRNHVDPPEHTSMISIPRALLWQCPLGKWMPTSGNMPASDFEHCLYDCAAGFYGNSSFETSPECTATCPVAHFCPAGSVAPTACPAGTYLGTQGARGRSNCIACSPGEFSAANASLACTPCPAGTLSEAAGASACAPCPVGGFCAAEGAASARQVFEACTPGTFNPTRGATNSSACLLCPVGTASPMWGSGDESNCALCTPNTYNSLPGGDSIGGACLACPERSLSPPGSHAVHECVCEAAYYDASSSSVEAGHAAPECLPCLLGATCPESGTRLADLSIRRGYWRTSPVSTDVRRCPDALVNCSSEDAVCAYSTSGCRGGADATAYCAPGLAGVFCRGCNTSGLTERVYYDAATSERVAHCAPCGPMLGRAASLYLLVLVLASVSGAGLLVATRKRPKSVKAFWSATRPEAKLKVRLHGRLSNEGRPRLDARPPPVPRPLPLPRARALSAVQSHSCAYSPPCVHCVCVCLVHTTDYHRLLHDCDARGRRVRNHPARRRARSAQLRLHWHLNRPRRER